MEKSLTAAGRMRRRFKAGRPAKVPHESMSLFGAMEKLSKEAGRAKDLMLAEGLDPDDIQCALMLRCGDFIGKEPFPEPGSTFEFFEKIAKMGPMEYLGILWRQIDREAGSPIFWVTQFMGGPDAEKTIFEIRDAAVKDVGGSDN